MKSIINISAAFFLMIGFVACEKAVLGESEANTQTNNLKFSGMILINITVCFK